MRACATFLILCLLAAPAVNAATPVFEVPVEQPAWTTVKGSSSTDSSALHDSKKSLRIEPSAVNADAGCHSAPINLTVGKTYELTGWVRTEDLTVRDIDRSPIALGAALSMASMPFDVHSASLGGT